MRRRQFLVIGIGVAGAVAMGDALASSKERRIRLHNIHTGEYFQDIYWSEGAYIPDSLAAINNLLRDHRTGDRCTMDPGLLDMMCSLRHAMGKSRLYHVVSGYRSPSTNALLRREGYGAAKHSLHMVGKAVDFFLQGVPLQKIHRTALRLRAGGVGYYPLSNFIHIDTGPVRHWKYPAV